MIKYIIRPLIVKFLVNSLALYLLTVFLKETFIIEGGVRTFLIAGLILGILNFFIKPILKILSLPFVLLSGGLFLIVINGIIIYLLQFLINALGIEGASLIVNGGFLSYGLVALVFGIINWLVNIIIK